MKWFLLLKNNIFIQQLYNLSYLIKISQMYTTLKSKRHHFQIPSHIQSRLSLTSDEQNNDQISFKQNQTIVSSCFLDDVFILFLFNTGRYLIINSLYQQENHKHTKNKNNKDKHTQILHDGNIIDYLANEHNQKEVKSFEFLNQRSGNKQNVSHKRLLTKNSLNFIQQSLYKVIFTDCKRINSGQCVIITKHSKNVYLLKLSKYNQKKFIQTNITELPQTMVNVLLTSENNINLHNLTILTQLMTFNNSYYDVANKSTNLIKNQQYSSTGNFAIKNQIIQDKMIYLTVYLRQSKNHFEQNKNQKSSQKYRMQENIQENQSNFTQNQLQYFIVNFQYPLPINEQHSNFVIQVCDKFRNQIAIYKQTQIDQMQWQIKIFQFSIINEMKKQDRKLKVFTLPPEFNSCIYIQQFIRWNDANSYILVSFNQNDVMNPEQIISLHNCRFIHSSLNSSTSNDNYIQSIEKLHNFNFNIPNFIRIINVNQVRQVFYILSLGHQRVDGQLYENKIDICDMRTGVRIERGYCSLKNYSFSPNQRYILDVPHSFNDKDELYFHIRVLFSKKSLYLFLMQNENKYFEKYQDGHFIQKVLSLL